MVGVRRGGVEEGLENERGQEEGYGKGQRRRKGGGAEGALGVRVQVEPRLTWGCQQAAVCENNNTRNPARTPTPSCSVHFHYLHHRRSYTRPWKC